MRAFIFPGQGSQAVGMGRALAEASGTAREVFQEVDEALGERLSRLMAGLKQSGGFALSPEVLATVRSEFDAVAVPEPDVMAEIALTQAATGVVLDPHSAIGVRAGRRLLEQDPATPVVAPAPPTIRLRPPRAVEPTSSRAPSASS